MQKFDITFSAIEKAYHDGVAQLDIDPVEGDVICRIGENWFYFNETDIGIRYASVEEFKATTTEECIIQSIHNAMLDIGVSIDAGEYEYYRQVLTQQGCMPSN